LSSFPLVIDLDGTLLHTDMLHESVLQILRNSPQITLSIPFWLLQGKAVLKKNLATRVDFDVSTLPYNLELLNWLKQQKLEGRKLILCTASDISIATKIAEYLNIFDEVIASDGQVNLGGRFKAHALINRFGSKEYDYIGNSNDDLAVWEHARKAIVVNFSNLLYKKVELQCEIERSFPSPTLNFGVWRRAFRMHQWLKNLLLFVPMLAAHQLANAGTWHSLIIAFLSFSLCASSVYIANDLLDLESDRQHPRKCKRPFAAGNIPIWMGVLLAPVLFFSSLLLGQFVGATFVLWLLFYFGLTCAYSWGIKRLVLLDCLTLAMLYTLRILAGASAAEMSLSFWLLGFSVFLFLSLAFVKRYAELEVQLLSGNLKAHGRGYYTSDAVLIQTMGITSGYASILVLALYLNSDIVLSLYRLPEIVWLAVPIMLFWVSWMWMQAHRGKMHDDPLVFAVKDPASLLSGLLFAVVLMIGAIGLPW